MEKIMRIGGFLPELSLKAYYEGKEVSLKTADYKGKWKIFVFYPADFTFVCPTELEELADMYADFQKEKAEIFSVSRDTVFVHKAWQDHSPAIAKIKFPMVSDTTGELAKLFDVYIKEEGLALRGSFIIDPEGKLVTMEVNDNSIGRSGKELLRKLRAAKFIRDHGNVNVCPASWQPGDETLTPGMDLVGKI
jgi:peroxiredoxin (alkyl hydroperoxide reductase subunit C)